jgi:hypothetical protein
MKWRRSGRNQFFPKQFTIPSFLFPLISLPLPFLVHIFFLHFSSSSFLNSLSSYLLPPIVPHSKLLLLIYTRVVKGGRHVRLTILLPSVSRLSRENLGTSMSHKPMGLHGLLQGQLYLFYYWPLGCYVCT